LWSDFVKLKSVFSTRPFEAKRVNVPRRAYRFTFFLLLVVVIIGGTGAGLLLMAVYQAREAANRSACKNNLRQQAIAFQNHQDQRGDNVPLALFSKGLSWAVLSGDYLEGCGFFYRKNTEPFNSPQNQKSLRHTSTMPMYYCPSRRAAPREMKEYAAGDYAVPSVGVVESNDPNLDDTWLQAHDPDKNLGPFLLVWRTRPSALFRKQPSAARRYRSQTSLVSWIDGASNQIVLGEKALHPSRLNTDGKGGDFTIGSWIEKDYNASGCTRNGAESLARSAWDDPDKVWPRFGSWHRGICQFAYGDGRVEAVSNYIDASVLRDQCDRGSADPKEQKRQTADERR
jgi:hypothetical protein